MPAGWLRNPEGIAYPPPPWRLGGMLAMSLWRVKPRNLPIGMFPASLPPQLWLGRAVVATAFAVYEPGGVLSYNEFLLAVRVKARGRGMVHVPRIWVDSPGSIAGARALWAVPKQEAEFAVDDRRVFTAEAFRDSAMIAGLRFAPRFAVPGWWRTRTLIAQEVLGGDPLGGDPLGGDAPSRLRITRVQALSRLETGSSEWVFSGDGPAGFLLGHRPFASLRLKRMTMAFGV